VNHSDAPLKFFKCPPIKYSSGKADIVDAKMPDREVNEQQFALNQQQALQARTTLNAER